MHRILSVLRLLLCNTFYAFCSLFWKREKDTVVFGSWFGERFADNPRYLFQYLHDNKEKYGLNHIVWLTRNEDVLSVLKSMDYETYMINSSEAVHFLKTSAYQFVCNGSKTFKKIYSNNVSLTYYGDIEPKYSFGAVKVHLQHGTGLTKAVDNASNEYKNKKEKHPILCSLDELLTKNSRLYRLMLKNEGGWGDCYMVSPSQIQKEGFMDYYSMNESRIILSGYPRNCRVVRLLDKEKTVLNEMKKYKYILLYLPTFRKNISYHSTGFSDELMEVLKENNILWIEKTHIADNTNISKYSITENIIKLDPIFDINVIIPQITMLVTDYSSTAMDAMYHKKSVLYYIPDYEEYKKNDVGFSSKGNISMCGPKLFTLEELKTAIEKYISNPDSAKTPEYNEVRKLFWNKEYDNIGTIYDEIIKAVRKH